MAAAATEIEAEIEVLLEARRVIAAANAVLRTMDHHDPVVLARGLTTVAAALAGTDQAARTAVAIEMIRVAISLDPHVADVVWQ